MSISVKIEELLNHFEGISLGEVEKASLMRRRDCKFLFSLSLVPELLEQVKDRYRVLEIGERRTHFYESFYYDTPELEMYHMHHRGQRDRYKVRFRKYVTSGIHFLEVKRKNARGMTIKKRVQTPGIDATVLTSEEEFLRKYSPYGTGRIIPTLENSFYRVTLVGRSQTERITMDYGLRFKSRINDREIELPGISVAEIKYEQQLSGSAFYEALRRSRILPSRFSKYAIGMALMHDNLKQNLFKPRVRRLHQINREYLQTLKNTPNA